MTSRIARLEVIPVYSAVSSANDVDGTADTVIRRIADFCELMGAEVVPHGWKTGITSAVGRHFQAACPAAPVFEYVYPHVFDIPMRRELVSPEPAVVDGYMALPAGPGLGIELNEELVSS